MAVTIKVRSPAFPFIPLAKALERAGMFYDSQRHHPAPVPVAVGLWQYKPKSSGGLQTIAALKQFGLMEDEGQGSERAVHLSELALRIIRDQREKSPDREAAIKEAALTPRVHRYLWEKWSLPLPDHQTIRYDLVHNRHYTESAADEVITIYEDTIAFAGLASSDKVESPDEDGDSDKKNDREGRLHHQLQKVKVAMNEDVFTLKEGNVTLQWPDQLSRESYEDLETWAQLILRKVKRHIVEENDEPRPEKDDIG